MPHNKNSFLASINKSTASNNFLINCVDESNHHTYSCHNKNKKLFNQFNKEYNANEIIMNHIKRKPYIVVNKVYTNRKSFAKHHDKIISSLQQDIIKVFHTVYHKQITVSDIKILDASGIIANLYQVYLHFIVAPDNEALYYIDSKYTTSSAFHLYTSLINLDKTYINYLNSNVYGYHVLMRIIGSTFNSNTLDPIDPDSFDVITLSSTKKLDYMLSYIDESKQAVQLNTPIIDQSVNKSSSLNNPSTTAISNKITNLVKLYYPSAVHESYQCGFHNFSYRDELCIISNRIHKNNNKLYCFESDTGIYLKCRSAQCKTQFHLGYLDETDEFMDHAIQINSKYLMDYVNMDKYISKWIKYFKVFAIKSKMGTGKTTTVKHILDKYGMKKILWITHRQTLSFSTDGSFNKYNFVNYLDVEGSLFDYDRVIVQVDSLTRIRKTNPSTGQISFNKYDLVVIDEVEGGLNHFSSPFLNNSNRSARDLFDFMLLVIKYSDKLLLLDADIDIRTKIFIDHIGYAIVINNLYQPDARTFIITNNSIDFESSFYKDVNDGKNICVVSMLSKSIKEIAAELTKKKIIHVIHTSESDDALKHELKYVNNFWSKYQVVLYSPTIESGVDFNIEHFDKIYCIIADGPLTCSQRSFLQMVGRIRKIRDNNILCLYRNIIVNKNEPIMNTNIYTFDDILGYLKYYEDIDGRRILHKVICDESEENGVVTITIKLNDITVYDKITIHNEAEQLNKHGSVFITILQKLINKGGHEIKFKLYSKDELKTTKKTQTKEMKTNITAELINSLVNIDESEYDMADLMKRQRKSKLNETEKLVLKRYDFRNNFGISQDISKKQMRKYLESYLGKELMLQRFELLFGYANISDENSYEYTINEGKEKVRHDIVINFINLLLNKKYTKLIIKNVANIVIQPDQYAKAITNIMNKSIYSKNIEKYSSLFFGKKSKFCSKTNKSKSHCKAYYVNILRKILDYYGIVFRNGTHKKHGYEHILTVNKHMLDIVNNKHKNNIDQQNYVEI